MKRGQALLQILALLVSMYGLVLVLTPTTSKEGANALETFTPDWFGEEVRVIEMNEAGVPKREFKADRIVHYQKQNMTDLFNPHFTLFSEKNPPWHLVGDKGRTFHGKRTTDIARLDLWHNVTLWQEKGEQPTTMKTSTIAIFPEEEFAQTDQAVSLKQPGHLLTGVGLKAYFDSQAVELFSQVRSEHAQVPSS